MENYTSYNFGSSFIDVLINSLISKACEVILQVNTVLPGGLMHAYYSP